MQAGQKRKRDMGYPRITFHAAERTFDRLFKEESLSELRDAVKAKIGLPPHAKIVLKQLRAGQAIDLEDEDDFDAFYLVAHSQHVVEIQIDIQTSRYRQIQKGPFRHKSNPPESISGRSPFPSVHAAKKPLSEKQPSYQEKPQGAQTSSKRPLSAVTGTASGPILASAEPAPKKQRFAIVEPPAQPQPPAVQNYDKDEPENAVTASKKGRSRKRHKKNLADTGAPENKEEKVELVAIVKADVSSLPISSQVHPVSSLGHPEQPPKKKKKKEQGLPEDGGKPGPIQTDFAQIELPGKDSTVDEAISVTATPPSEPPSEPLPKKKQKRKRVLGEGSTPSAQMIEEPSENPQTPSGNPESEEMISPQPNIQPPGEDPPTSAKTSSIGTSELGDNADPPKLISEQPSKEDVTGDALSIQIKADLLAAYGRVLEARRAKTAKPADRLVNPTVTKAAAYKSLAVNSREDPIILSDDSSEDVKWKPKRKVSNLARKIGQGAPVLEADNDPSSNDVELPAIRAVPDKKQKRKVSKVIKDAETPAAVPTPDAYPQHLEPTASSGGPVAAESKNRIRSSEVKDNVISPSISHALDDPKIPDVVSTPDDEPDAGSQKRKRRSLRNAEMNILWNDASQQKVQPADGEPTPTSLGDIVSRGRNKRPRGKPSNLPDVTADGTSVVQDLPESQSSVSLTDAASSTEGKRKCRVSKAGKRGLTMGDEPPITDAPLVTEAASIPRGPRKRATAPTTGDDPTSIANSKPPRLSRGKKKAKTPAFVQDSDDENSTSKLDGSKEDSGPDATSVINSRPQVEQGTKPPRPSRGMKGKTKAIPSTQEGATSKPDNANLENNSGEDARDVRLTVDIVAERHGKTANNKDVTPAKDGADDGPPEYNVKLPLTSAGHGAVAPTLSTEMETVDSQVNNAKQGSSIEVPSKRQSQQPAKVDSSDEGMQSDKESFTIHAVAPPSKSDSASIPDLQSQSGSAFSFPFSLPMNSGDIGDIANVDLDALIRGPPTSQICAVDLMSSPESSDESGSGTEDEPQELLVDDMEEPHIARRSSRKPVLMDTSESEHSEDEVHSHGPETEINPQFSRPQSPLPAQHDHSFKSMVESERELDDLGDNAFHSAFAEDEKPLQPLRADSTPSQPELVLNESVSEEQLEKGGLQELHNEDGKESEKEPASRGSSHTYVNENKTANNTGKAPSGPVPTEQLPTPDGSEVNDEEHQPSQLAKLRSRVKGRTAETAPPKARTSTENGARPTKKAASKVAKPLQALSSYAPPRLISLTGDGRQLRGHNKSAQSQDSQEPIIGASQWEVLNPARTSSSPPEAEYSQMIDELQSDTADLANDASDAEYPLRRPPLFVLTESSPPFPYSQWGDGESQLQQQEKDSEDVNAKDDQEDSEDEIGASVRPKKQPPASKFRRLTDIARDHSVFATPSQRQLSRVWLLSASENKVDAYGRTREKEDSDTESESEDSDEQAVSHIPCNRRAGVSRAKK